MCLFPLLCPDIKLRKGTKEPLLYMYNDSHYKHMIVVRPSCLIMAILITVIPTTSTSWSGVYWFHLVHPSVRPSICLWTESCPLSIFYNTNQIHFIFTYLIHQLNKVCRVLSWWKIPKIWTFNNFFKFVALNLSCFHVIWKLKLIPDLNFYYSHFEFSMMIPLDGLIDIRPTWVLCLGKMTTVYFWHFFNCAFHFMFVVATANLSFCCSHFEWHEIQHADVTWPPSELIRFWSSSVDFPHFGGILT